jgi:hypothetical protein
MIASKRQRSGQTKPTIRCAIYSRKSGGGGAGFDCAEKSAGHHAGGELGEAVENVEIRLSCSRRWKWRRKSYSANMR